MSNNNKDLKGIYASLVLIGVGVVVFWDTLSMVDQDSYIFPRVVGGLMIFFCCLFIFSEYFLKKKVIKKISTPSRTSFRSLVLAMVMIVVTLMIPYLGFLLSGIIVFWILAFIAEFKPLSLRQKFTYMILGVGIITTLYLLFAKVLSVPLPTGYILE